MTEVLDVRFGFHTTCGRRALNADFAAAYSGPAVQRARMGVIAALADGVGSTKNSRMAAETSVRSFIDGYYAQPDTIGVERAAAISAAAANRWLFAHSKSDSASAGSACTLTAVIFRGRQAHIAHIGDSRLYRLRAGELERLTADHTFNNPDTRNILLRALGTEANVRVDYAVDATRIHDRFILCSDGVHGTLRDNDIRNVLLVHGAPDDAARALVDAALAAGSDDNVTALVADVAGLPKTGHAELQETIASLPILDPPPRGAVVDNFQLREVLADGDYSRIFDAYDLLHGRRVVVKFPKRHVAREMTLRLGMMREIWVPSQIRSEWVGEAIEQAAERQTQLYSVMPFYEGETLEQRLLRKPHLTLSVGVNIAIKLAKAVAALHRARVVHRDIKPENVILGPNGGLKLIDLGVAYLPNVEEFPVADIPGTPSYMAPELFDGAHGDELSDQFALGVVIYRMFSGGPYPYGETERFSRPRFGKPVSLLKYRPELPLWLDALVAKAIALEPDQRFTDTVELAFELEANLSHGHHVPYRRRPLYERNPVLVWQGVSFILFALLVIALMAR